MTVYPLPQCAPTTQVRMSHKFNQHFPSFFHLCTESISTVVVNWFDLLAIFQEYLNLIYDLVVRNPT